jgi:hypothetical protein
MLYRRRKQLHIKFIAALVVVQLFLTAAHIARGVALKLLSGEGNSSRFTLLIVLRQFEHFAALLASDISAVGKSVAPDSREQRASTLTN